MGSDKTDGAASVGSGNTEGKEKGGSDKGNSVDDAVSKDSVSSDDTGEINGVISSNEAVSTNRMMSYSAVDPLKITINVNGVKDDEDEFESEAAFKEHVVGILSNNSKAQVGITLTEDNYEIEGDTTFDFAEYYDRVTIDLNGKTLVTKAEDTYLYAKSITGSTSSFGSIKITPGKSLHISSKTRNVTDEDLKDNPVSDIMLNNLHIEQNGSSDTKGTKVFFDGKSGERIRLGDVSSDYVYFTQISLIDDHFEKDVDGKAVENNVIDVAGVVVVRSSCFSIGGSDSTSDDPVKINLLQRTVTDYDVQGKAIDTHVERGSLICSSVDFGYYNVSKFTVNNRVIELNLIDVTDNERTIAQDIEVPSSLATIESSCKRYTAADTTEAVTGIEGLFTLSEEFPEYIIEYSAGDIRITKAPWYTEIQLISTKAVPENVVSGSVVSPDLVAAYSEDNPIKIHVGEYVHIGLRFIGSPGHEDVDVWNIDDYRKLIGRDEDQYIYVSVFYNLEDNEGNRITTGKPVDRCTTAWESLDGVSVHLLGTEVAAQETCFLSFSESGEQLYDDERRSLDNIVNPTEFKIPVIVEEAETGVEYPEPDHGNICKTRQQAYQAIRDIITSRTNKSEEYGFTQNSKLAREMNMGHPYNNYVYDRIVVRHELFNSNQIMMEDVCDFNAERSGMKPNEGDYIMHCIGDSQNSSTYWMSPFPNDKLSIQGVDGERYDIYEVYLPMMTTKAEEDAVDAEIASLMSSTFAGVKDGTNAQKIKAVYDYVTGHVRGTVSGGGGSDRTWPKYHTAYHALIKGNGTCESYAMLFSRLSRELGVPSKVIMGVDANNHTYNIVENDDGYWYYIDCSAGIYLRAANEFSRASEQSKFTTQEFINSYLSKIKKSSYQYKSIAMTVIPSDGSPNYTGKYEDVAAYIVDRIRSDPDGDTTYNVRLDGNVTISNGQTVDFGPYMDRVSFDLNGKTLTFSKYNNENILFASEFKNGTIALEAGGGGGTITVGTNMETLFGRAESYDKKGTLKLTDIKFRVPQKNGQEIQFDGCANIRVVMDNVSFENLICEVPYSGEEFSNPYRGYIIDLKGNLSLNNSRLLVNGYYPDKDPVIRILRTVDDQGNKTAQGSLSLTNSEIGFSIDNKRSKLHVIPVDVDEEGNIVSGNTDPDNSESSDFASGDLIAKVSGSLKWADYVSVYETLTSEEFIDSIFIDQSNIRDGCEKIFEEGTLFIGKPCISVTSLELIHDENGDYPAFSGKYASLTQAIKALDENQNNYQEFRIQFEDNVTMPKDLVIPAKISRVEFTSVENLTACLDLAGHTLSYSPAVDSGAVEIMGGLQLKSTGVKGSIKAAAAKNKVVHITANPDISNEETAGHFIDNVDLIAGGQGDAYVDLKTNIIQGAADPGPVYRVNSDINATKLKVDSGRFKVNNVTAKQIDSNGDTLKNSLEMNDAVISGTGINMSDTELKASKLTVNSGNVSFDERCSANIGTLEMKGGIFMNEGDVRADTVSTIVKLDNKPKATFKAGSFNMASNGGLFLEPGSTFHAGQKATIYNLYLGQDAAGNAVNVDEKALISRLADTVIVVNTKVQTKNADDMLSVKTVDDENGSIVETKRQTKLFTTNIKAFPLDVVELLQPEGITGDKLMQVGTVVLVAADWIEIYANNELIQRFAKWSDAMKYINTINNANMSYKVVLSEDVTTCEDLAFPKSAKSFALSAATGASEPVRIRYTGNINLTTDTEFGNLILEPQVYDKKTGEYIDNPSSIINLNGKNLLLFNTYSDQTFASVTGSGSSTLSLQSYGKKTAAGEKMTLNVINDISVPNLDIYDYAVKSEKKSLTVAKDAYLRSADINVAANVAMKDLHTIDEKNSISYGAAANNTFKISGIVDQINEWEIDQSGEDVEVSVRAFDDGKAVINKNAVSVSVKYLENGGAAYTSKDIVSSAKAPASCFVIGREEGSIQYALSRVGNALRVASADSFNVILYLKKSRYAYRLLGNYPTLQEALTDIDRYADKTASYRIEIDKAAEETVTPADKRVNLTMPKQAELVTITTKGIYDQYGDPVSGITSEDFASIHMNNTLNLNTNLVLDGVKIADNMVTDKKTGAVSNTRLNIGLGGSELSLKAVPVNDSRIGNITGNGTAKDSGLHIAGYPLVVVNGNLNNVGWIYLDGSSLRVTGRVNVGECYGDEGPEYLIAPVKSIKKDKNGNITEIVPNITITDSAETIKLALVKPDGTGLSKNDIPEGSPVLTNGGFAVAAAPKAGSASVSYAWADDVENMTFTESDGTLIKRNGNLVYTALADNEIPFVLRYQELYEGDHYPAVSYCLSFADAVAEINKLAVKRDYTIAVNNGFDTLKIPANMSMPKAGNIAALKIMGADSNTISSESPASALASLCYTGTAITLTCPTTFENVQMKRTKLGSDKKTYVYENTEEEDYLTATTVKASGYDLTCAAKVTWDTPLNMDGGKKGSLIVKDDALLYTTVDKADSIYTDQVTKGAFVNGSLTNFAAVNVGNGQKFKVYGFKTANSNGKESYVVPSLTAATIDINGGSIEVGDFKGQLAPRAGDASVDVWYPLSQPANVSITDLTVVGNGGDALVSHGKLTITNMTLMKNSSEPDSVATISADRDFSIANKGTLVCGTSEARLYSRRNSKGVPYLTIPGTVQVAPSQGTDTNNRIGVGVRYSVEDVAAGKTENDLQEISLPEQVNGVYTDASRQLLTAAGAGAEMFKLIGSSSSFLIRNEKTKTILAYDAATEKKIIMTAGAESGAPVYYYPSWADAVNAINHMNDSSCDYTVSLGESTGIGWEEASALTMPAKGKARSLTVTTAEGASSAPLYYTGNVTLTCPMIFTNIDLNPLASVKKNTKTGVMTVTGAKSNITAGDYDLTLNNNVTVGSSFNSIAEPTVKAKSSQLGNITSATGRITLASPGFADSSQTPATAMLAGNITSTRGTMVINEDASVAGNVSSPELTIGAGKTLNIIGDAKGNGTVTATALVMEGGAVLTDTVPGGKITVTGIVNNGTGTNTINYGRNARDVSNLEIKGEISGTNIEQPVLNLAAANGVPITGENLAEYESRYSLSLADMTHDKTGLLISNPKVNLTDAKKLLTAPKLYNGRVKTFIGGGWPQNGTVAKANNAFWIVKTETDVYNTTTRVKAVIQNAGRNGTPPAVTAVIDTDAQTQGDEEKGKTSLVNNRINLSLMYPTSKQPVTFTGAYLDWNQAITEINNLNDPEARYEISTNTGVYDTNLTDGNWRSALAMPGKNKAAALYVKGQGSNATAVRFSGSVTTYGHVEIEKIQLNSQNNKGNQPADFNITMNPNSTQGQTLTPGLCLNDVTTMADSTSWGTESGKPVFIGTEIGKRTGFIGKISGSRSRTENLQISASNIRTTGGVTNVNDLRLCGSDVIAVGGITAENLSVLNLAGEGGSIPSTLTALAASTVGTVKTEGDDCNIGTARKADGKPLFTITGTHRSGEDTINIRAVNSVGQTEDNKYNVITYMDGADGRSGPKDIGLVIAPRIDAVIFAASDDTGLKGYKDAANTVYVGDEESLPVLLGRYGSGADGYPSGSCLSESYARSYADAIAQINSIADPDSAYKITFRKGGEGATESVAATVNGTDYYSYSFGALTWPKANTARSLVISGVDPNADPADTTRAELRYTGILKPNTKNLKVRFENIILTEGTTKNVSTRLHDETAGKDVTVKRTFFVPNYSITPDLSGADGVEIEFGAKVNTLKDTPNDAGHEYLTPGSIDTYKPATTDERVILGLGDGQTVAADRPDMLVFSKVASTSRFAMNRLVFNGQKVWLRANSTMQGIEAAGNDEGTAETVLYTVTPLTVNGDVTGDRAFDIHTAFTDYVAPAPGKPFAGYGSSQLVMNGEVFAPVEIHPYIDGNGLKYNAKNPATAYSYAGIKSEELKKLDASGNGYAAYSKLSAVKKGNADRFTIVTVDPMSFTSDTNSNSGYEKLRVRKNNSALYVSTADPKVRVIRYASDDTATEVSRSELDNWAMAVTEIDKAADKTAYYDIVLLDNDGGFGGFNANPRYNEGYAVSSDTDPEFSAVPLPKLDMPSQAKHVTVKGDGDKMLITTASKITFKCDTDMQDMGIIRVSALRNRRYNYNEGNNYDLAVGGYTVNLKDLFYEHTCNTGTDGERSATSHVGNISGTKNGKVVFDIKADAPMLQIGAVTGVGELWICSTGSGADVMASGRLAPVTLIVKYLNVHSGADINVTNLSALFSRISSAKAVNITDLNAEGSSIFAGYVNGTPGDFLNDHAPATADLSITNAELSGSNLFGQNINVKTKLNTLASMLSAGTGLTSPGQGGKVTVGKICIADKSSLISAKQDKNGKSQINVTGTVNQDLSERAYNHKQLSIRLYYNDYSGCAKVYDGIPLVNAPKAEASWFFPVVSSDSESTSEMGHYDPDTQGVYKSGSTVCFGNIDECEAELEPIIHNGNDPKEYWSLKTSRFKTFEEAVKEIDTLNRRYQITGDKTWHYEDYQINILNDVDITNAKGAYQSLPLPSAVGQLTIHSDMKDRVENSNNVSRFSRIRYSGALNIKSNTRIDHVLLTQMAAKPQNLSVGNFTLCLEDVYSYGYLCEIGGNWSWLNLNPLEFAAVNGSSKGKLEIREDNASADMDSDPKLYQVYPHDSNNPYVVKAGSVAGLYSVELNNNSEFDVSGNYGANRTVYKGEAKGLSNKDLVPTLKVGGNLTTQQIQKAQGVTRGGVEKLFPRLYVASAKTNKITGIQDRTTKKFITFVDPANETVQLDKASELKVHVTDSDRVGTKVLNIKALGTEGGTNPAIFELYGSSDPEAPRGSYCNGDNLMLAN
ncbi:MAG: hypothetical protein K6G42_11620 [Lachnospiraceae bacterium]|nr:hypothetical protein [Lachnospiraceae bacterium]